MTAYVERAKGDGGYMMISYDGAASLTGRDWSLSGCLVDDYLGDALAAGLLVVDCRPADFPALVKAVVGGPMFRPGRPADDPPYHALSSCPVEVWLEGLRGAGAAVHNDPTTSPAKSAATQDARSR